MLSKFLKKKINILVNLFVKMTFCVSDVYGNCPGNMASDLVQPKVQDSIRRPMYEYSA